MVDGECHYEKPKTCPVGNPWNVSNIWEDINYSLPLFNYWFMKGWNSNFVSFTSCEHKLNYSIGDILTVHRRAHQSSKLRHNCFFFAHEGNNGLIFFYQRCVQIILHQINEDVIISLWSPTAFFNQWTHSGWRRRCQATAPSSQPI